MKLENGLAVVRLYHIDWDKGEERVELPDSVEFQIPLDDIVYIDLDPETDELISEVFNELLNDYIESEYGFTFWDAQIEIVNLDELMIFNNLK